MCPLCLVMTVLKTPPNSRRPQQRLVIPCSLKRRLAAADEDRAALFGETQRVELEVRREKAKKAELQESAQHYRGLLKRVL